MARKLLVKSLKELLENLPNVPIAEELFGNSNSAVLMRKLRLGYSE